MNSKIDKSVVYNFFTENSKYENKKIISMAMEKFGFTQSTAATYFYAWKKDFMKPSTAAWKPDTKLDVLVEIKDNDKVCDSGIGCEIKDHEQQPTSAYIPEEKSVELPKRTLPRLKPLVMQGIYGKYIFNESGVERESLSGAISSDVVIEEMEALAQWERYYKEVV
ncbi:hypothetical protein [Rhodopseudomonas parapalustris]